MTTILSCIGLAAAIVVVILVGVLIYKDLKNPLTQKVINKIKEWLVYAVAAAEEELGLGTGELKLRYVYDMFIEKFPTVSNYVSFETLSEWVDEALLTLNGLLSTNSNIQEYIYKWSEQE